MKKINPKVIGVLIALMSVLVAGGIAARDIVGEATEGLSAADQNNDGMG